jgi:long-chain fatty acid transport protein
MYRYIRAKDRADLKRKILSAAIALVGLAPAVAGAQGIGLPAAGFAAGGTGLTSFYVIGFELGPWQEYLAQELTPDYLLADDAEPVNVSWLRHDQVMLLPEFATGMESQPSTRINLRLDFEASSEYRWQGVTAEPVFEGSTFERQYFAPGLQHQYSDNGVLGVSAVVAYQRYSAASLGLFATSSLGQDVGIYSGYQPYQESGYGTGVRLAVHQEVVNGVALDAGFQSRIDMEEFAAYRGVYSSPADLDIPARASLAVALKTTDRSWLSFEVERVMYSDISAFPSRALPNRFLSLLGDSTSPNFDWEDLTVYTVGYTWSDGGDQEWRIDLSTRTQPSPSSRLLDRAIAGDLADSAMVFGYSRRTGDRSRLNLNAAYAPAEYAFGGSVLGVTTEELDQQFEVEAMWTLSF